MNTAIIWLTILCLCVIHVKTYGILKEPPARGSLWRFGYDAPVNVEDDRNDCGGTDRLWHVNSGNCGMCGDAYDLPVPRPHEVGGLYGQGLITRRYLPGEYIDVEVNFTRNMGGYFQFSICKVEDFASSTAATVTSNGTAVRRRRGNKPIKCKNRRALDIQETDEPLFTIDSSQSHFYLRVKLPKKYQCQWCILIWEYWTASPCGFDQDCDPPQGQLKACADVSILADFMDAKYPIAQTTSTSTTTKPNNTWRSRSPSLHDDSSSSKLVTMFHKDFESFRNYIENLLPPEL